MGQGTRRPLCQQALLQPCIPGGSSRRWPCWDVGWLLQGLPETPSLGLCRVLCLDSKPDPERSQPGRTWHLFLTSL